MALSAKETLMYFGYTYAPNLTHQGASIITEKSSATLHTMVAPNLTHQGASIITRKSSATLHTMVE
jgi:hypothetical protein